jgi:hypothetical protein
MERADDTMSTHRTAEADLVAALELVGIVLDDRQIQGLLPGAAIMRRLIEHVRVELPREAEPAVVFGSHVRP